MLAHESAHAGQAPRPGISGASLGRPRACLCWRSDVLTSADMAARTQNGSKTVDMVTAHSGSASMSKALGVKLDANLLAVAAGTPSEALDLLLAHHVLLHDARVFCKPLHGRVHGPTRRRAVLCWRTTPCYRIDKDTARLGM